MPSYNGEERLPTLLNALAKQTHPSFEVVVVLDGSTDGSESRIDNFKAPFSLRAVKRENGGRAAARNTGVEAARGEALVFYDDDMEPEPDSIVQHLDALARIKNSISVGQALEYAVEESEFAEYKTFISAKWVEHLGSEPVVLTDEDLFLTAANMAVHKEDFHRLEGFDKGLKDAEDFDLAVRAKTAGMEVLFDPGNIAYHRSFTSFAAYIRRQRQYREAHEDLLARRVGHPRLDLYGKYSVKKSAWKKLAYFPLTGAAVRAVDGGLFSVLPKKWKFAVYERVVSALSVYYPHRRL